MAESIIQEGFICPICYIDMHSPFELLEHSRTTHGDEEIKAKTGGNIRSLLNKAKMKLVNRERQQVDAIGAAAAAGSEIVTDDPDTSTVNNVTGIDPLQWEPQRIGYYRDHMKQFKVQREEVIAHITTEVNKLTIRLEQLMKLVSAENSEKKRKELEKTIVRWKPDKEVPFCQWCSKSFNVRRRRHHCRLCGSIMCKRCSIFLLFSEARLIVYDTGRWDPMSVTSSKKKRKLQEDSDSDEDEHEGIRLCESCDQLMDRKLNFMRDSITPPISILYQKLLDIQREATQLRPQYIEMSNSLYGGLSTYSLEATQKVYQNLIRHYESLNQISKKIAALGAKEAEASSKSLKIKSGIQQFVSQYLQDHMIGLRPLPTPEMLQEIREKRERDNAERAALEEAQRKEAQKKAQEQQRKLPKVAFSKQSDINSSAVDLISSEHLSPSSTWIPASLAGTGQLADADEDPFLIQRRQLLTYLEQARSQGKMDEVETLQFSLQQIDAQIEEQSSYN